MAVTNKPQMPISHVKVLLSINPLHLELIVVTPPLLLLIALLSTCPWPLQFQPHPILELMESVVTDDELLDSVDVKLVSPSRLPL